MSVHGVYVVVGVIKAQEWGSECVCVCVWAGEESATLNQTRGI